MVKDIKIDEGNHVKSSCDSDTIMSIDAACNVNGDFNTTQDSDSDSDPGSLYNCDKDCDTDDDCDIGPEETRLFLYRHFTISIVANQIPGKPNLVFIKATLLYTKGEDNNPRI